MGRYSDVDLELAFDVQGKRSATEAVDPAVQYDRDQKALGIKQQELQDTPDDPALQTEVSRQQKRMGIAGTVPVNFVQPTQGVQAKASIGRYSDADLGIKTELPPMPHWSDKELIMQGLKDAGYNALGNVAGIADMFAGLPGMAMNIGAYTQARMMLTGMGESNSVSAKAAKEAAAELVPDALSAPFHKIMESLGYGDQYNDSTVSKGMSLLTQGIEKGSAWLSNKTGGVLQPEDFEVLAQVGMLAAGTRGGDAALTKAIVAKQERAARATYSTPDVQAAPKTDAATVAQAQAKVDDSMQAPVPEGVVERNVGPDTAAQSEGAYQNGTSVPIAKPKIVLKSSPNQIGKTLEVPEGTTIDQIKEFAKSNPEVVNNAALGAAAVAAGGWLYMNPEDADAIGVGGLAMAGAVKGKGGMWHPEAVERLSRPLNESLLGWVPDTPEGNLKVDQAREWSQKTIKNYLNKHAGTDTDPLKDVRVPMMGDDVRWEDLTDQIVKGTKFEPLEHWAGTRTKPDGLNTGYLERAPEGTKAGETVWNVHDTWTPGQRTERAPLHAITSYLSHVGDYLREFVLPKQDAIEWWDNTLNETKREQLAEQYRKEQGMSEHEALRAEPELEAFIERIPEYGTYKNRLNNYDLVRAVKETAAQDERQRKAMESAQSYHSDKLVANKVYPDGYSWREVGTVKELTPEMAATVKKAKTEHGNETWQAFYPDGKPVLRMDPFDKNAPGKPVYGATQLEAYNNGHLANEGNTMGHCVGGYCEYVHSGESKIFSLRDPKGMSHVTIEVAPRRAPLENEYRPRGAPEADIVQIKGKQNRAPVDKYLPYVQDFVKSGKWGDVEDLQNAKLNDLSDMTGFEPSEKQHIEKTFPGQRFLTQEDLDSVYNTKQGMYVGKEQGNIDPALLRRMAAVGVGALVGAYADSNDKLIGAALGGIAGLALSSGMAKRTGAYKSIERGIKVSVDQFARKLNPDALGPNAERSAAVLAKHMTEQLQKQVFQGKLGAERQQYFSKMPEVAQLAFTKALEIPGVRYKDPKLQAIRTAYTDWMNRIYQQDIANGIKYEPLDNYVYHIFADPDGASVFFQQRYGTKWGDPKFTKERSAHLISEAEAAGFKLKYTNPEQIAQARQLASDVAQMKVGALRELASYNLARPVTKGMKAGPGESLWRSPNGELYFLPDHVNQVFHNAFNTKDLWSDAGVGGMTYRGSMWVKNAILPVKLMSGFHALHIGLGMNLGTTAVNSLKLLASGKQGILETAYNIGKSAALVDTAKQLAYVSRKMQPRGMQAFRGDIPVDKLTELDKQQMQVAYEAGFSPEMSEEYRNQSIKDFSNAVARRSAAALWHAPFALLEATWTRPMFQNWIPAVKWDALQRSAAAHLEANPHLADDTLARMVAYRKLSKMVDDRFGEVQYKTIFMDKMIKDIGVASFLSYGWQLGFVRSYMGAVPEAWRAFTEGEGTGPQTLRQKIASGKVDKTLFVNSYLTGTMLYGGLLMYAMSGKVPEGILDYIYPRTGDKNKDGTDARVSTPFYTREFVQIPSHVQKEGVVGGLATTVSGKLTPVLGMMKGIVMNKDYFNRAISNSQDDVLTTAEKKGKWLLGELEPMSMNRPKNAPDTTKSVALGMAGFNPAPKYVTHPQQDTEYITIPKRKRSVQ